MTSRSFLPLFLCAGLTACASLPPTPPPVEGVASVDPASRALEQQRQQAVRARLEWGFAGRVAVSNGRDGGNARLDWQQDGAGFQTRLSAPVTRQGWELSVDHASGMARLEGLAGGPRAGADARQLVAGATGWDLPVDTLGDWVRGLLGPQARLLAEDAQGRPLRAEQDGWTVDFAQWYEAEGERPVLPRRIDAVSGQARVRLLVDQWNGWEQ